MKAGDIIKCINDKNLPQGANIVEGKKYTVISSRMNNYEQKIVFLVGVANNGTTKMGLEWNGYDAKRFGTTIDDLLAVESEEEVLTN